MYWLSELCVRRPVFAMMLILAFVVAGIAAFPQLGVDRFPNMDLPTVYVRTTYPGAASAEVESEVSQVIEDAVATVAGIDELRSISRDGQSFVIVTFNLNRNSDAGAQDVRDAVSGVLNLLPPGIDPPVVQKQDLDSSPILSLAVSGPRSAKELYLLADRSVKNVIESAPGVGEVTIAGAAERAIQVEIDANRLAAHQLSILQVRDAIARQNAEVPGGLVDEGRRERSLRTLGRVDASKDFPGLVISTVNRAPDPAPGPGHRDRRHEGGPHRRAAQRATRGDHPGPAAIRGEHGPRGRGGQAADGARPRCLPPDVKLDLIQDQSRYIVAALHEIESHLIVGSLLACLTVLLFMRSWRSTLIASVAIPASIIATFAFMRMFGFTLNNMTMLALVLMVGVVIDDAIVVLENIFHCIEERGMGPVEAAIRGTREIGPAVLATTLSLIIVFLPVSFLSSVTGRMLYEFGITASVAILVSMLVSFSLTPMMCSRMLRPGMPDPEHPASRGGFYGVIERSYLWCLGLAMRYRWLVLVVSVLVIASNVSLYRAVQRDYIPTNVDESEFEIRVETDEGASMGSTDEALRVAERFLLDEPGVETVLTTIGGRGAVNQGEMFVRLTDIQRRTFSFGRLGRGILHGDPAEVFRGNFSQQEKMVAVRKRLGALSGVRVSVRNLTSLRQGAPWTSTSRSQARTCSSSPHSPTP